MNIGKASAIFMQINDDRFTTEEKAEAIYLVLNMATHNGVTKNNMLAVVRYLFDLSYAVENHEEEGE